MDLSKLILVTGSHGFIGSNLVRKLLIETDYSVVAYDAMTYASRPNYLESLLVERPYLRQRLSVVRHRVEEIEKYLNTPASTFHAIIHLAAESHVCRSIEGPDKFLQANSVGSFALLEWVRKTGVRTRVVMVSTDEVFGELGPMDPPFQENTPLAPRSPYAATKAAADLYAMAYFHTYGLNVSITNCCNNYGHNQHEEKLIPRTIEKFLKHEPATIYGTGKQVREWIHVDDHNDALLAVMQKGVAGKRYMIGSGEEVTNFEMILSIMDTMIDAKHITHAAYVKTNDRPTDDFRYAVDSSTTRALGWAPKRSLKEHLRETIDWYVERWKS
jgi:dTDP-glucose 4,6-dehydratase